MSNGTLQEPHYSSKFSNMWAGVLPNDVKKQIAAEPSSSKSPPVKARSRLPLAAGILLDDWLTAHRKNPYPTADEKKVLVEASGLSLKQVNNWFMNARRQQLDPMTAWLSSSSDDESTSVKAALSLTDAFDTSKGMLVMSQSDITSRNIYYNSYLAQDKSDTYGFPIGSGQFSSGLNSSNEWSSPNNELVAPADSNSSCGSAFDQCADARWSALPRRGRRAYAKPVFSRSSSISSASLGPEESYSGRSYLPGPAASPWADMAPAPQSMMGQFSSKVSSSTQKKHKCEICDKRFTRPSSLQTHMYCHTSSKLKFL